MAKSNFQIAAEYWIARTLLTLYGVLPRALAIALGRLLGRVAYLLPTRLRRTGLRNLEIAFPDLSLKERKRLLRGSFDSLGRLLGEFSQFPRLTRERLRQMIEYDQVGLAHLRAAEAEHRGVIFLTGHLGASEILSFGWSALEYQIGRAHV